MAEDRARRNLREFRYWRENKEQIILDALKAGIPISQICAESGLHNSVVYTIRKKYGVRV